MRKILRWLVPLAVAALLLVLVFVYVDSFYHADAVAEAAMASDDAVSVRKTDFGWLFDGASEADALIFYPGGKVESRPCGPLGRAPALKGMVVCLVRMPRRRAILGKNKADGIIDRMDYERWVIGGHSLGGVSAALYAAKHPEKLDGVVLLAAYADQPLDDSLSALSVYGSEDGVLNRNRYQDCLANLPAQSIEHVIEGGNHSQFGSYGAQEGDGAARIPPERQVEQTVAAIVGMFPATGRGDG